MEDISCKICFEIYSEKERIPKILECGHSLCLKCLSQILVSPRRTCPECNTEIMKGNVSQFPTVFSLIALSFTCKTLLINKNKVKTAIKDLKEVISQHKKHLNTNLSYLQEQLTEIEEIGNKNENNDMNADECLKELNGIQMKVSQEMSTNNYPLSFDLHLKNFKSPQDYLSEICKMIEKGEQICAAHQINNKLKFGKVSYHLGNIYIYSLSMDRPKGIIVSFQHLKDSIHEMTLYTFFSLERGMMNLDTGVTIEMHHSPFLSQFVKLCSGELGPTYKGSSLSLSKSGDVKEIKVQNYMLDGAQSLGQMDYMTDATEPTFQGRYSSSYDGYSSSYDGYSSTYEGYSKFNGMAIFGNRNGSFSIIKEVKTTHTNNIIGKLNGLDFIQFCDSLINDQCMKIVDCGIAVSFK